MTPQEVKAVEMAQKFKMPWGKYKGIEMDRIKSGYLPIVSHHADVLWNWREEMDQHI